VAKKSVAKKAVARTKTAGKAAPKKVAPKQAASKKAVSKKAASKKAASNKAVPKKAGRKAARTKAAEPELLPQPPRKLKSPFTKRQLNPLRKALMDLRARVSRDMNLMGDEAFRASESEVDVDDVADFGSDAFERTMTLSLLENEARTMQQINEALELMDKNVYGLCQLCFETIPLARLEVLPFAQTCVSCQEAKERRL
jgi:RNA polymerase-binding protein DksA